MNAVGPRRPRVGCSHRTSASTATVRPDTRSTIGWYSQQQLVVADGPVEVLGQLEPVDRFDPQRRLERADRAFPAAFAA